MRVLISAFACRPGWGSEPGVGWNWAHTLSAISDHQVTVLTQERNRGAIEAHVRVHGEQGMTFRYVSLFGDGAIPFGTIGHYLYYYLWQLKALLAVLMSGEWREFELVHHLTYGGIRTGSLLWLLPRPFMFGPVGGGEMAPMRLVRPLGMKALAKEGIRTLSNRLSLCDPVLFAMQLRATRVLARTQETKKLLRFCGRRVAIQNEIAADRSAMAAPRERRGGTGIKLLYAGRLIYWKGATYLLEAMKLLDGDGRPCELDIAGEGDLRPDIEARARSLDRCEVRLHGRVDQARLFELYREADVLILPSLHDSGGTVVIEALSFGLPVICFDLGGPPLIMGGGGIAIDVSRVSCSEACERLANAIRVLRDDPVRHAALVKAAVARAAELSWENTVRKGYGDLLFGSMAEEA